LLYPPLKRWAKSRLGLRCAPDELIRGRIPSSEARRAPFRHADALLKKITAKVIFIDFHAEATSEKVALGWYLDGRVTALIGTHTHIPTADSTVLPGGTAYQTDCGMTGPYDGVIGVQKEQIIQRFLNSLPGRFEAASGDPRLCAVLVDCDETTGKATSIERIIIKGKV
jgi:2',3'-cyclic-nucleotide 2'-phosphodiesterase